MQVALTEPNVHWRLRGLRRMAIDVYAWLIPLAMVNLIWFLLCLTVILIPPATAALYEVAYDATKGYSPGVGDYLGAVRRWLFKSWLWGAATALFIVAAVVALNFYAGQQSPIGDLLFAITGGFVILIWMIQFFFWPYVVLQQEARLLLAARNALFTVLGDPLLALLNGGLALVLLAVSVILVAPLALITPAAMALLGTYSLREWLLHHHLLEGPPDG